MGKKKRSDCSVGPRDRHLSTRAYLTAKDPHEKCTACASHRVSKQKKKVKASSEDIKYGSVSKKLLNATAQSRKLQEELSKLLKMESPIKLQKNKSISEIVDSTPNQSHSVEKTFCPSDCMNRSDCTDSNIELSEPPQAFTSNRDDIKSDFVSQRSETLLKENYASDLNCSATETKDFVSQESKALLEANCATQLEHSEAGAKDMQHEVENQMGHLLRKMVDCKKKANVELQLAVENQMGDMLTDVDVWEKKENVKTQKDSECINPVTEFEASMQEQNNEDDTDDISYLWRQMLTSFECSKSNQENVLDIGSTHESDCNHSFIHKEDLGHVCKLCGLIGQRAETIFDFDWSKACRRSNEARHTRNEDVKKFSEDNIIEVHDSKHRDQRSPVLRLVLHPLLEERMHQHQRDGFEFLIKNLITEEPGGCILAHAPGTGKTFLVTSFIQSFLRKYPEERPLIVAPKTMLYSWMKEFKEWQVEEVPLYNLYEISNNLEPLRCNQLEILKEWREKKSILLVSYAQFSSIVSEKPENDMTAGHQSRKILLECPGLLILDEGHFPRNSRTNILNALMQVRTRRRVLLSGTLFQNNITELFTLLKLVRPDIHEEKSFKAIFNRILTSERCPKITNRRHHINPEDRIFCGEVEHCLQNGSKEMKASAICDLQELVSSFVHYYKGEILEDLPGLADFAIILKLNSSQQEALESIKCSAGSRLSKDIKSSAVCIHPSLRKISIEKGDSSSGWLDSDNSNISDIVADPNGGVKTKFVLDILSLCKVNEEKLLVFSQFLSSLTLLENMIIKTKNWTKGSEILRLDGNTASEVRETIIQKFNNSEDAKVLFASIRACGEGINLTGASRVVILDIPWNPSITRQAISRAFRIGQKKKVYAYRLIAADTFEEEIYRASFDKEVLSKMIFDRNEKYRNSGSLVCEVDENECEDPFFESKALKENVKSLYKLNLV